MASLFGYRNGSIPISNKAWRKLEQAECKAGIGMEEDSLDLDQPIPEELAARFAEIVKPLEDAKAKLAEAAAPIREMREEMASMQQRLGNIEILLERLLEKDTAPQTSSPARGKTA